MNATEARINIHDRTGNIVGELRADVWDLLREAFQQIVLVEEADLSLIPTDAAQDVLDLLDL